ncbi:hypothetical protein GCM10009678_25900 [Actinomadura kijaniata]|uniref:Putative Flp pilus-assembly TadG-like N-terminal domain-containing protein n=1 Tax=Actinomadura namibiensis TaxID=182080 RepID=A0A7W3QPG9_ACTNM|nr:TadE family protein [Actinomadura namibiensis]MBA8954581.1 hypothetical protein [Actinomadura namibiensis]
MSREPDRDRGAASLYVVLFTPIVFVLAGLLVDGGLAIHARQRAADIAEQAARAGADEIDDARLRETGEPILDPGRARAAACAFVGDYGDNVTGRGCDADEDEVTVEVQLTVDSHFLGILPGLGSFTVRSSASAQPMTGQDDAP